MAVSHWLMSTDQSFDANELKCVSRLINQIDGDVIRLSYYFWFVHSFFFVHNLK